MKRCFLEQRIKRMQRFAATSVAVVESGLMVGTSVILQGIILIWIRHTQVTDMVSLLVWKRIYFILLLLLILEQTLSINTSINDIAEARLIKDLNLDGRPVVRPVAVFSEPVNVEMLFYLIHLKDLDVAKQTFTVTGGIMLIWNDPFLTWSTTDYDNISVTRLPAKSVWLPGFRIANSLDAYEGNAETLKSIVYVQHDGNINWFPTDVFNVACNVNTFSFPFDTQTCYLKIQSNEHSSSELIFTGVKHSSEDIERVRNLEWELINEDVTTRHTPLVSIVEFGFTLKRQPTYHVLTVIVPIIVLFIVGLLVFALPVDSGEKVSLCVACLMSYFLTQVMIAEQIPKSWNSVPIIMVFNTGFMLLNVLSVVSTVLVLNLHHRKSSVPGCLQRLLAANHMVLRKRHNAVQHTDQQVKSTNIDEPDVTQGKPDKCESATLSYILDEIRNVRKDMNTWVQADDLVSREWKEVATVVNAILCCIYLIFGVIMGCVFIALWVQG